LKIRMSSKDFQGSLSEGPEKGGKRDMASKECRGKKEKNYYTRHPTLGTRYLTLGTRHPVLDFPLATLLPGGADCVLGD